MGQYLQIRITKHEIGLTEHTNNILHKAEKQQKANFTRNDQKKNNIKIEQIHNSWIIYVLIL